jgi:hypothetical protein
MWDLEYTIDFLCYTIIGVRYWVFKRFFSTRGLSRRMYTRHDESKQALSMFHMGTRQSMLGHYYLDSLYFPMHGTLTTGMNAETHQRSRDIILRFIHRPFPEYQFSPQTSIDCKKWWLELMWLHFTGKLCQIGTDLVDLQNELVPASIGLSGCRSRKRLLRRHARCESHMMQEAGIDCRATAALALDTIIFAGGLSVPMMMKSIFVCCCAYPNAVSQCRRKQTLDLFVLEALRLYPPVDNVCFTDSTGEDVCVMLAAVGIDTDYWGPDSSQFRIRSRDKYESGVGFFNFVTRASNRSCPGQDIALAICTAWVDYLSTHKLTMYPDAWCVRYVGGGLWTPFQMYVHN